ncbi:alpha-tocopherol transfer protein-like isoform X2 [Amblyomma americanum]
MQPIRTCAVSAAHSASTLICMVVVSGRSWGQQNSAPEASLRNAEDKKLKPRTDEEFLVRFLRVRKYDVEAARRTVQKYYRNRAACPTVYSDFVPSSIDPSSRRIMMVLPSKDAHGRLVILFKAGVWVPSRKSYDLAQKAALVCLEHMAADPASQTAGVSILVDSDGFSLNSLLSCNLSLTRRFFEYLQDCMPMRLKGLHIIHESKAMDFLFAIMRPFIKRKLAERIHFHGTDYKNLHEEIPPTMLPEEYGGEAAPLDIEGFWRQMELQDAQFFENNRFGYPGSQPIRRASR